MTLYLALRDTSTDAFVADTGEAGVYIGDDGVIYNRATAGGALVAQHTTPPQLDVKGSAANVVKLLVEAKTAQAADIVQVKDASGAVVFSVKADGTVHIKTGGTVAADL